MVSYDSPFAFVIYGMGSGLVWSMALHYVFLYIGVAKAFASKM